MQTEKKTLSKREQVMMLVLVVVAVFAVTILYVIVPSYNRLIDRTDEYNALEFEKIMIISTIASESAARGNHDALIAQYDNISSRFLCESSNNEIGRMLTGLCEMHSLQPIDQNLQPPVDLVIGDGDNAGSGEAGANSRWSPVFLVETATMTLIGEYSDLMRLLDTVEQIEYIRISRVTYAKSMDANLSADRIAVQFEVIMLKDDKA